MMTDRHQIRWMGRADVVDVLRIDRLSFSPWMDEAELVALTKQRDVITCVAETQQMTDGFMIYRLLPGVLELLRIAVLPSERKRGIGTQMVERLKSKLAQQNRRELIVRVPEKNLGAQLFFSRCGMIGFQSGNDVVFSYYAKDADL